MVDFALSSLTAIRARVRRLTRSPSTSQLSTIGLDSYINSFILYDMPAWVKLDSLKTVFTFYTKPHQEKYGTIIGALHMLDTFYHFRDKYTNIGSPIYVDGSETPLCQSRSDFYRLYPPAATRVSVGTGNGANAHFAGSIAGTPVMKNEVSITSVRANNERLLMTDNGSGVLSGDTGANSTIDYLTGEYDVTFNNAPKNGSDVYLHYASYTAGKPNTVLFFHDEFILRPVPDDAYRVDVTVYKRPATLLPIIGMPELSEWYTYIAYGAAIAILQDRLDMATVELLIPEFERQELLINRRKIVQNSGKRAQTIFSSGFKGDL